MKYLRHTLLIKRINVIIAIKYWEILESRHWFTLVVLYRRERKLTFLFVLLPQALFCSNHHLRAHKNISAEETNGANTYSLVYILHLGVQ